MIWVKIRSWHLVTRTRNRHTRCGLAFNIPSPSADDLPLGERSCETCLRLMAWDAERARLSVE